MFVERTEYFIEFFGDNRFDIRREGKERFFDDRVIDYEKEKSVTRDPANKVNLVLNVECLRSLLLH